MGRDGREMKVHRGAECCSLGTQAVPVPMPMPVPVPSLPSDPACPNLLQRQSWGLPRVILQPQRQPGVLSKVPGPHALVMAYRWLCGATLFFRLSGERKSHSQNFSFYEIPYFFKV